jgi:hypothetical protein
MISELALHKAVQAWCTPTTEKMVMVPELVFAFAEIIEEEWSHNRIGNATTRELLKEIDARKRVQSIRAREY